MTMAGFLTTVAGNKILDALFGGKILPGNTEYFVGLSHWGASKAGLVSEPNGADYWRVVIDNNSKTFHSASNGVKKNRISISFPAPESDWGIILSVFLAEADGTIIATADLFETRWIRKGDQPATIPIDALLITFD